MTIQLLLDELRKFLENATANYKFETKGTNDWTAPPQVVVNALPPNQSTITPNFPYVIIRFHLGDDKIENGHSQATVRLILGSYSQGQQGYRDILSMTECIRLNLLKKRVIGNKFMLLSMKYGLVDEEMLQQVSTHSNGFFEINFRIGQPQIEEDDIIGCLDK